MASPSRLSLDMPRCVKARSSVLEDSRQQCHSNLSVDPELHWVCGSPLNIPGRLSGKLACDGNEIVLPSAQRRMAKHLALHWCQASDSSSIGRALSVSRIHGKAVAVPQEVSSHTRQLCVVVADGIRLVIFLSHCGQTPSRTDWFSR